MIGETSILKGLLNGLEAGGQDQGARFICKIKSRGR